MSTLLVLEPYYGGSHRSFLKNLCASLRADCTFLTYPASKWKWRMRLSAPLFAEALHRVSPVPDAVLCSTFVDVATLRGLGPRWLRDVSVHTYFHENQFTYPVQVTDERDVHFCLTNLTTALASDSLAFNSRYNFESFLTGIGELMPHVPDMCFDADVIERIRDKSTVISPGIDFSEIDAATAAASPDAPVIVWNHRWEHDKNPEEFFHTLYALSDEGEPFSLVVAGERFQRCPPVFDEARERLQEHILQFGYVPSRAQYAALLRSADVVVSTARHEFFGIAVLEAVRAGARPVLPQRLSYPELFDDAYLYQEGELKDALREALRQGRLSRRQRRELTGPHELSALIPEFESWLGLA